MNVTGSKDNHIGTLSAQFKESGALYISQVFPDDWVGAWIVYGEEKYKDLVHRIKNGEACNGFEDGLKFMGKVGSLRKSLVVQDGKKIAAVTMQASMFTEFAAQLFYDPQLRQTSQRLGDLLGKLNIAIQDLMSMDRNKGIDTNKFMPIAIDLLVGSGAPASYADPATVSGGSLQVAHGPVQTRDQPAAAYIIPHQVGKVLGASASASASGLYSYADVLCVNVGIQKFDASLKDHRMFVPRGADTNSNRNIFAKTDAGLALLGSFLPAALSFTNKPLWSLLNEFLNPVMNEMYTALRVNYQGQVVPTLVVRQHPLTSDTFFTLPSVPVVSRFLEMPRWKADGVMVKTYDVGRSGSVGHFNFFHVYGAPVTSQPVTSLSSQIARNPPLSDEEDFRRNGILPYMTTVNCSAEDAGGGVTGGAAGAGAWMACAADFHLGSQYMFNGTVGMQGVSLPICHGDNFEWDNTVYHIENCSHSCGISADGKKYFTTYMALSHGVHTGVRENSLSVRTLEPYLSAYPGVVPEDFANDPGFTADFEE
jgi:hypothetical protein